MDIRNPLKRKLSETSTDYNDDPPCKKPKLEFYYDINNHLRALHLASKSRKTAVRNPPANYDQVNRYLKLIQFGQI